MSEEGLIARIDGPDNDADARRKYYRITPEGRGALSREIARLERILRFARARGPWPERT